MLVIERNESVYIEKDIYNWNRIGIDGARTRNFRLDRAVL